MFHASFFNGFRWSDPFQFKEHIPLRDVDLKLIKMTDPFQQHEPIPLGDVNRFLLIGETIGMCEPYYGEETSLAV